jgi:hypothetical protein
VAAKCGSTSPHTGIIDADERAFVIDQILATLHEFYVREELAQKMVVNIRARQTAGDYDRLTSAVQFVQVLTRDLQAVSGDKHLVVEFSAEPIDTSVPPRPLDGPVDRPPPPDAKPPRVGDVPPDDPCLFVNVAVLAGNIGYLKFDAFRPPDRCVETAAAAMRLVSGPVSLRLARIFGLPCRWRSTSIRSHGPIGKPPAWCRTCARENVLHLDPH